MPDVYKTFTVKAPIASVWDYVKGIGNWAALMPGYQSYQETSDAESLWTLKVDLGPFTRMIELDVLVTERVPPDKVAFTVKSRNEPVFGKGMYQAAPAGSDTGIALTLEVHGSGPMAPVIGVMAKPVLDRMADSFSKSLAAEIERRAAT